jgi:hypothetical protein
MTGRVLLVVGLGFDNPYPQDSAVTLPFERAPQQPPGCFLAIILQKIWKILSDYTYHSK